MDPICEERLEQNFLANEVEVVAKRRAILLSVCGSKTYALARDLLQPVRLIRRGYDQPDAWDSLSYANGL